MKLGDDGYYLYLFIPHGEWCVSRQGFGFEGLAVAATAGAAASPGGKAEANEGNYGHSVRTCVQPISWAYFRMPAWTVLCAPGAGMRVRNLLTQL